MARVSATSSLGMKVGLGHLPGYTQYDSASPHHSITIERDYDGTQFSDEELVEKAESLHKMCKDMVEKKIQQDLKDLKK